MRRLTLAAICSLLACTISGQTQVRRVDWKLVELIENDRAIYIQNKKKFTKSGTIKVWAKIENFDLDEFDFSGIAGIDKVEKGNVVAVPKPSTDNRNLKREKNNLITMSLYEFNCKEEMLRVNYVIWYRGENAIASEQRKEQWSDVIPESIGEILLKTVCKNEFSTRFKSNPFKTPNLNLINKHSPYEYPLSEVLFVNNT